MDGKGEDSYRVKPGQEVVVDRFRADDAEQVAACFRRVYGEGYPIRVYYDPESLILENEANSIISVVARTTAGEVVGHVGMFSSNPCNPGIYESGSGLVLPEYRNTARLFSRMVALSEKIGRDLGLEGIYGESVCNHPFSQKMMNGLGYMSLALEVDLMPAEAYTTEGSAEGRVSSLWDFKTLVPYPHTVYIPEPYADFFRLVYRHLDDEREMELSREPLPHTVPTRIDTQVFDFAHVARMAVLEMGGDFGEALQAEEDRARGRGVVCFQAWLNLADPWVQGAVQILRQRGYFLGGLLARWFRTDGLLMQKLLLPPLWEEMQIIFQQGHMIADAVRRDWEGLA